MSVGGGRSLLVLRTELANAAIEDHHSNQHITDSDAPSLNTDTANEEDSGCEGEQPQGSRICQLAMEDGQLK